MPRDKASSRRATQATQQYDSSTDDEDNASTSQWTQSGRSQAIGGLSEDQLERLVTSTVYYMLLADQKKTSIKKLDIKKLVLKEYSKSFDRIFAGVQRELKHVFGIEVKELEGKHPTQYILLNALDVNPEARHIDLPAAADNQKLGLLTVVLSLIYMNGNRISERVLWQALKQMGLSPETPHRAFGDVHKLLTKEFVRQLYLEYTRVPESDPITHDFTWGSRAILELSKMDLLNVVCQVYGNVKPEQWVTQYKDASQ